MKQACLPSKGKGKKLGKAPHLQKELVEILRLWMLTQSIYWPQPKPMTPGEPTQAKPNPSTFLGREKVKRREAQSGWLVFRITERLR